MDITNDFQYYFTMIGGNDPFPWQEKLFHEFINMDFRPSCPVPTGLGKTSIISIWLLALAHHAHNGSLNGFPRRLAYVVNRRTVVDQATEEAKKIRDALVSKPELQEIVAALESLHSQIAAEPLAISTLRGQFADNAEWRNDPARPAVVVGTVDMIGSRLLFSGYGCGFKSRPLHAGFLGQDTLLVHDEAHLEPAFQGLATAITAEQLRRHDLSPMRVMELTATTRTEANGEAPLFTDDDRKHDGVRKRIEARKGIVCHPIGDKEKMADKVVKLALAKKYKESGQAILIFLREVKEVKDVAVLLPADQVVTLTGTLRGWERDALAREDAIFARFMRGSNAVPQTGTVYLVCTSAGEVGVNISADHLVCDLTPFDSMMQRFGRVNRFGDGDACIDIVHRKFDQLADIPRAEEPSSDATNAPTKSEHPTGTTATEKTKKKGKVLTPFDRACGLTHLLLQSLPKRGDQCHDASPAALASIPAAERQAAFTPPPVILPATDILFDAWSLTTIRQKLPGRPPVADWLHGVTDWEPPATYVAWREEVELIIPALKDSCPPDELLEDYPLKPHELLRDQAKRVFDELEKIACRKPEKPVWFITPDGEIEVYSLAELVARNKQGKPVMNLADCTVLLPPSAGGLKKGMLDGNAAAEGGRYDIADEWLDENMIPRRCRLWGDKDPSPGMRLVRTITISLVESDEESADDAEAPGCRNWHWYVRPRSADDDGSRTARVEQSLESHCQTAEAFARRLVVRLGLGITETSAVVLAARRHDYGKDRLIWQRSIGNREYPERVLAKSGKGMRPLDLTGYRHEFGALLDIASDGEFRALSPEAQDLALHLIAAHHGRARPHFPAHEAFDHDWSKEATSAVAREVPRRFGRLQRRYGRWGLAYLESLVRAADIMASQTGSGATAEEQGNMPEHGGEQ